MAPIPRGRDRLSVLIHELHVRNYDSSSIIFVPEKSFLAGFDEKLLDEVLADLYSENELNAGCNDHIYQSLRKTIAILCEIGHGNLIYDFCKHLDLQDKYLPFNTHAFVPLKDEFESEQKFKKFAGSFYKKQFQFLAVPLRQRGHPISLDENRIVPIVSQTHITTGGFAFVSEIKIHEEYDRLGMDKEKHVYAMKRLKSYENSNDKESRGAQDKIFTSEVDTHYQLARLVEGSGLIIPLLAAFKQHGRYMMIFPLADRNLSEHFNLTPPPETDEDIMDMLKQVRGIISALVSVHNYCKLSDAEEMQDQATDAQGGTRKIAVHRDLSPQNILVRGRIWMISDFGHAEVRTLKEGQGSGGPCMSATSTYQAPECRFVDGEPLNTGRPADVWSLACILSEVFSFMVLGQEGLADFIEMRKSDAGNRDAFHSHFLIKASVVEWLNNLKNRAPGHRRILISGVVDLLLSMFQPAPQDRPTMSEVRRRYAAIISNAEYPPLLQTRSESNLENKLDRLATAREDTQGAGPKAERSVPPQRTSKDAVEFIKRVVNPNLWAMFFGTSMPEVVPSQAQNAPVRWPAAPVRPGPAPHHVTKSLPSNSLVGHPTAAKRPAQHINEGAASRSATATTSTRTKRSHTEPTSALSHPRAFGDMSNGPVISLKDHETVFLIDDSIPLDSNSNTRVHMGQILINLAHAAAQVDHDGIDLHFAGNPHCDRFKVKSWTTVMESFSSAEPRGRETMSQVDEILSKYMARFRKHQDGQRFERLNLIVLTDGETGPWDFWELRANIKRYIEDLDSLGAPQNLMGVQFVLVGEDSPNKKRFKELDDLHKTYSPRARDIVDVTELAGDPAEMETELFNELFNKILCGGVMRVWDEYLPGTGLRIDTRP